MDNLKLWKDRVKDAQKQHSENERLKDEAKRSLRRGGNIMDLYKITSISKVTGTPKAFEMIDNAGQPCTVSLVEFLMDNREELTVNNRKELHRAAVGDIVIINGFVGHQAFLKRIK